MEPGTVLDISMLVNGITFTEVEIIIGNGMGRPPFKNFNDDSF